MTTTPDHPFPDDDIPPTGDGGAGVELGLDEDGGGTFEPEEG